MIMKMILIIIMCFTITSIFGQYDEYNEEAYRNIKNLFSKVKDRTYLRDFHAELEHNNDTLIYSMLLSKQIHYQYYLSESLEYFGKGKIELRTESGELIGAKSNEIKDSFTCIDFKCMETGVYNFYIIKQRKNEKYIGTGVLVFVGVISQSGKTIIGKTKGKKKVEPDEDAKWHKLFEMQNDTVH
jgi:hypothetical protein